MAQSRLERIGTIFTRTTSLLRGGAMAKEDCPLWYVIYEAFPPKVEPRFDRPVANIPVREILYKEDLIRAKFQKDYKKFLNTSLVNTKNKSRTQKFISIYEELEKSGIPEEELYTRATEAYEAQIGASRSERAEQNTNQDFVKSLDTESAKEETKINMKDVFKA
ncbi:28S ribosomal protein S23, mitochondrial [Venturia canescens]|uniref:28S ribosomal protein S23, mitochondrial n=1 Tax=Venturia canescens TaxID=32260 RepID=UPI001C9D522F|nr:28S ribosomal protein S23, mitochondrial [Venturia canescens]